MSEPRYLRPWRHAGVPYDSPSLGAYLWIVRWRVGIGLDRLAGVAVRRGSRTWFNRFRAAARVVRP